MSIFTPRPPTPAPADVAWATPDTNLWVATVDGTYAGMVEFDDGHFVVRDLSSEIVATATSIPAAQLAFADRFASLSRPAAVRFLDSLTSGTPLTEPHPRPEYSRGTQH